MRFSLRLSTVTAAMDLIRFNAGQPHRTVGDGAPLVGMLVEP